MTIPSTPGSITVRLSNVSSLSSPSKKRLIQSVAHDIGAAFITIAQLAQAGHLTPTQTAPINDVIKIIRDTDLAQRRSLERRVARYERREHRWRVQRRWMQREFGRLVKRAEEVSERWRERVQRAEEAMKLFSPSPSRPEDFSLVPAVQG
ncbi:hypothetical protein ASPZODRAFT_13811 [Penicilliopsis zonata CBS 506.65]|uniref:Uncharacterized protein n=1 Tax=Penicilliopsis zonata CBS 506.65 TaxID=1073090 RepID=A0A1L9SPT2_9EURO|nr:hypothetical protein ASPZODRAFT_13811 [Penicilliopsis zonata CBS 506.65]OJJ49074.1 hypothetical protein ASPZODRAFT_13811 [Penicilliopsis zonata CBS 506.65]